MSKKLKENTKTVLLDMDMDKEIAIMYGTK